MAAGSRPSATAVRPVAAASGDRDVVITRILDAPRELVWRAWTEAQHFGQWWGPTVFTNPVCTIDLRVGGAYRVVMRSPDGVDYPITGVFQEIKAPERLVMTMDCSEHPPEWHDMLKPGRAPGESNPAGIMRETVTFAARGARTLLTIHIRMASTEIRDSMVKMGMNEGWSQSLERLAALVAGLK
jgi:uncharacterized protein YndB with AHSA1/START domain